MKKNKYVLLVIVTALSFLVGAIWAGQKVRAQSSCQPGAAFTAACLNQDAPNCLTHDSTRVAACSGADANGLLDGHCYAERRGGPNGQLQGYTEIDCESPQGDPANAPANEDDGSAEIDENAALELECRQEGDACAISDHLTTAIRVLSAMVGIVVACMIAWGGLQYTASRDNPQQAAEAKNHITNAIIALVFYIFSLAILNWLVPGGVI